MEVDYWLMGLYAVNIAIMLANIRMLKKKVFKRRARRRQVQQQQGNVPFGFQELLR